LMPWHYSLCESSRSCQRESKIETDCHQIRLASAKMLPTTSSRLAIINASTSSRSSQLRRRQSVSAIHTSEKSKNCDKEKRGVAAHSRSAGQELDLICNNNFV